MATIEDQVWSLRDRALVVARLCDASSEGSRNGRWTERRRETGFWNGLESLVDEFVSFLERLPRVVSNEILNLEMPPDGSPLYDDNKADADQPRTSGEPRRRNRPQAKRGPQQNARASADRRPKRRVHHSRRQA